MALCSVTERSKIGLTETHLCFIAVNRQPKKNKRVTQMKEMSEVRVGYRSVSWEVVTTLLKDTSAG